MTVTLAAGLNKLDSALQLVSVPGEWTEGVNIQKITVIPNIVYLGESIDIKVYTINCQLAVPTTVHGTVVVNGTTLTGDWKVTFQNPTLKLTYTPTQIGTFTAKALGAAAKFTVLEDIPGTYYSPFGGVRIPICTAFKDIPLAWNPSDAHVTKWITSSSISSFYGPLLAVPIEYTCKSYWDSKKELSEMINTCSVPQGVSAPAEWISQYATTCPTCGGTGKVISTTTNRIVRCSTCGGTGKIARVHFFGGLRNWVKDIYWHSRCSAGICQSYVLCPYCDTEIYGPFHTAAIPWDYISFARTLLVHIETEHPNHPLTEPAWF